MTDTYRLYPLRYHAYFKSLTLPSAQIKAVQLMTSLLSNENLVLKSTGKFVQMGMIQYFQLANKHDKWE